MTSITSASHPQNWTTNPLYPTDTAIGLVSTILSNTPITTYHGSLPYPHLSPSSSSVGTGSSGGLDIAHHLAPIVQQFNRFYKPIHGPLSLAICVFGIISNTLNVALLVKQKPLGGTNHLVTGLAVGQIGLLTSFMCFSVVNQASGPICDHRLRTKNLMTFVLFNVNVNLVFTMISVFHVTMLAVARYSVIMKGVDRISASTPLLLQPTKVIITVITIYTMTPILCMPLYFNSQVGPISQRRYNDCRWDANITAYQIGFSRFAKQDILMRFNFWFFGILGKLVPCILMVFLNMMLVCKLKSLRKRQGGSTTTVTTATVPRRQQNYTNTSNILLLVISLFFIVEFPQGILNLLSGLLGKRFAKKVYSPLGDFFEMLTVLYSSINFVLYCTMSTQFRRAFVNTFLPYFQTHAAWLEGCRSRMSISVSRNNRDQGSLDVDDGGGLEDFTKLFAGSKHNSVPLECRHGGSRYTEEDCGTPIAEDEEENGVMISEKLGIYRWNTGGGGSFSVKNNRKR